MSIGKLPIRVAPDMERDHFYRAASTFLDNILASDLRVIRRGGWSGLAKTIHSDNRLESETDFRFGSLGFRLVMTPD